MSPTSSSPAPPLGGKKSRLRGALGASRGRIIRQLLIESVLLAAIGGLGGLLLAVWGTELLVSLVPETIPRAADIHLDGTVLAFTFLASLGTGIFFGLAPAWHASRLDLRTALNDSARGTSGGAGQHRLRNALVVAEVAPRSSSSLAPDYCAKFCPGSARSTPGATRVLFTAGSPCPTRPTRLRKKSRSFKTSS